MNRTEGYINTMYKILKSGGYQRTLHYHNTPGLYKSLYEKQIQYISEHYVTYGFEDLNHKKIRDLHVREAGKCSIIIGMFDGYRNHFDIMYPILKASGLTAWYLLVADFLNTPVKEQEKMLEPYLMQYYLGEYPDRRYAMNWEEAREVQKTQVIVNHTSTHYFMKQDTDRKRLEYEICHSHELIEKELGNAPKAFSWLGGAEYGTNQDASAMLRELGYQYLIGYELEDIRKREGSGLCGTGSENMPTADQNNSLSDIRKREDQDRGQTGSMGRQAADWMTAADLPQLEEEIRYHQHVMGRIGIFSAVPAILPFYHVENPAEESENKEDAEFAQHFWTLAMYLKERLSFDEWHAAHKALDILAVNLIGKDFPYHEE